MAVPGSDAAVDAIEAQMEAEFGIKRPPHETFDNYNFNGAYYLIKDWLDSLGVSNDKIKNMSVGGLQRAYSAGRLWVQNKLVEEKFEPRRKIGHVRRGESQELGEGSGFKPGEILGRLKGEWKPESPESSKQNVPTNAPESNVDIERLIKFTSDKIEANFNDAEQRLNLMIRKAVPIHARQAAIDEVAKLHTKVSQETRERIVEIATQAAELATVRKIEELVPRRLEIITPKTRKILDAEPRHEAFERILFWLSLKRHVYIVGPHGTGKTHLFRQLSSALDLTYFPIGQTLTKYELSGHKGPTGEYIGTLLREAIETGGFVGIDEGDTWAAAAMVFLNTPLANGYCSFPDKVVEVHPDFICCIAANTWGHGATMQYQGRNPLDAASLDRFAFEEVDYDEKLEIQLYGNTPWTQYCHRVRRVARELRIYEAAPSMRGIEMGNLALEAGGDVDLIQKSVLWKGLAPDTVAKVKSQAGTFGKVNIREVA